MSDLFRVTIDRGECISCAACWTACPEFFGENRDDGLCEVVGQYRLGDNPGEGKAPRELEGCVNEAADGCPVEIIHIHK